MTIALRAAGTATAATAAVTAVNPAVPTGATTGDLSVLTVWAKPYNTVITTPGGWTKIGEATNGTTASGVDTGSTIVAVYVCESATVGAIGNIGQTSANTMGAAVNTYSKTADAWDFTAFTSGGDETNGADYSATGAAGIDVATGDWVCQSTAVNSDLGNTMSSKTIGGMAGATLGASASRQTAAVTTGNDSRGVIADIPVTAGSSNAAPTYTYVCTASTSGTTMWLRLRETTGGVTGTSAQTLPALTQAASGTYTPEPVTGTVTQTLPALTQAAAGLVASVPSLGTAGNKIVTGGTAEVLLRGANFMRSDWTSGYGMAWEQAAIPELKTWGGNVIVRGFASDPVNSSDAQYLAMLDEYVSLAQDSQMYVVFVWRSDAPNGAQPNVPDASAKAALPALAARYKGNAHVMYGLQVEPHGAGSDWATLRPVFETMVDDIRTASAPYVPIVMVPGSSYSKDVSGAITDPVDRSNIVYKSHAYEPSADYQAMFGDTYDANLPVFVGEFAPTNGATMTEVAALISFTQSRGIGWAAWWMDYSNQGTEALVVSATDLSPTDPWGIAVRTALTTAPPAASVTLTAGVKSEDAATSLTVTLPTGLASGDWTIIPLELGASAGSITTPSGWTPAFTAFASQSTANAVHGCYYRKWVSGDTDPVFAHTIGRCVALPIKVSGADPTTLIGVVGTDAGPAGTTTSVTAPSVTPTASGTMIAFNAGTNPTAGAGGTGSTPSGMSHILEVISTSASTNSTIRASSLVVGSGATGTKVSTFNTLMRSQGSSLVIYDYANGPITGTVTQTLPALTQAASGSFTGTNVTGTVAQTLPALTQAAVGSPAPPLSGLPASGPVQATAETAPFTEGTAPDADDPAIWVNPVDPTLSVFIGTNKALPGGGLGVYDLSGTRTQYLSVGKMNNVDIRTGVFSGRVLVISSNRTTNAISFFWLDTSARTLSTAGETTIGFEPYGCAIYVSAVDAKVYAFITENVPTGGAFRQYELTESGGTVSGTLVRSLTTSSLSEGLVADDATGKIFLSQEQSGFYVYGAEPGDGSSRTTIDTVGGRLTADVEGCAIAYDRDSGDAYVVVSSQGANEFYVYDLLSPHAYRKMWSVEAGTFDAVTDSDGIDITRAYLGPTYPNGLIVVQDGTNTGGTNFKLIDAGDVLGTYTLPAFTATAAQTLPALSQAAAGSAVAPAFTGAIASTLPALTQAAAGTTGASSFTGSVAQSLPALTQAIIGTTNPPAFTATAAQALPALTQSAAGTTAPPSFTGTITSTLPALTQAASGSTGTPAFTGTITQMLPGLTQAAAGDSVPPIGAGTIAQILPALTQSASGTTAPPAFTATTVQMLPPLTQVATGQASVPAFTATITGTLPPLTQAAVGAFMVAAITGIIAQVLPALTQAALDDSGFRDLTLTVTGPAGHPMSVTPTSGRQVDITGPAARTLASTLTGHPLDVAGPTVRPLTITGPRS